jgi:hypothetical protein
MSTTQTCNYCYREVQGGVTRCSTCSRCRTCQRELLEDGFLCATCRGESPLGSWCGSCGGQGSELSGCDGMVECGACNGTSHERGVRGTCTACGGSGRTDLYNSKLCPVCKGIGNAPS